MAETNPLIWTRSLPSAFSFDLAGDYFPNSPFNRHDGMDEIIRTVTEDVAGGQAEFLANAITLGIHLRVGKIAAVDRDANSLGGVKKVAESPRSTRCRGSLTPARRRDCV